MTRMSLKTIHYNKIEINKQRENANYYYTYYLYNNPSRTNHDNVNQNDIKMNLINK